MKGKRLLYGLVVLALLLIAEALRPTDAPIVLGGSFLLKKPQPTAGCIPSGGRPKKCPTATPLATPTPTFNPYPPPGTPTPTFNPYPPPGTPTPTFNPYPPPGTPTPTP